MTVRSVVIIAPSCAWVYVVSPAVGRDGRPPSLIRVGPRTEREREEREGVSELNK